VDLYAQTAKTRLAAGQPIDAAAQGEPVKDEPLTDGEL